MPKGIPLTEDEQNRRRDLITDVATRLFAENGFSETSMREIAEAAGMGKSTLYDFFKTKDEILVSYFEKELHTITFRADEISKTDMPAAEKLRQVLQVQLNYLLANKNSYLRLTIEAQRLSTPSQARIQKSRHSYQDLICKLIQDGINEGSFRPINPLLAMWLILSIINPVVFTTRPTGTPQEMLAAGFDMILKGIQA